MSEASDPGRVRVVPFSERHMSERYIGWLNDRQVVRYSELRHRAHTAADCRGYADTMRRQGHLFWAIETGDSRHIGNLTAIIDRNNGLADLSILIGERDVWGKGYGAQAWRLACRELLGGERLRKVRAGTMSVNAGMLAIMNKTGMQPDGVWRRHLLFEGREVDVVFAALFRGEGA